MNAAIRCATATIFLLFSGANLFAGGSGLNVAVVVNTNSANSIQLANYYCEQRQVPPQNVLGIGWTGGNVEWTRTQFETLLRAPLNAMLASRQLNNQIDYVLLSMDIPYRVTNDTGTVSYNDNGTTSALYYGFKDNTANPQQFCTLASGSASAYAGSEGIFRQTPPISATSNSWLVMMLTSSNLAQAKAIVDRGVLSDYSFPTQTVYLIKNTDTARNVRFVLFDDAVFDNRIRGLEQVTRVDLGYLNFSPISLGYQLGSQFGLSAVAGSMGTNLFAPGALADILTSYSGTLFEASGQTTALDYLNAGATASYGTVLEPCNYLAKFASPRNYFYQARGFSAAECYYLSVTNPYQGILVGEPLAAPFALPCSGGWNNLPSGALLIGITNLSLQFTAADPSRPVQQVDLFLDGTYVRTITNIPPQQNNRLYVTLPGGTNMSYNVPASATIKSVASGLASVLNSGPNTTATSVSAYVHGDRLELRSNNPSRTADATFISVSNYAASGLTTFLRASGSNFLASVARGLQGFNVAGSVILNDTLVLTATKTNGVQVTVGVTNNTVGLTLPQFVQQFVDAINADPDLQGSDGLDAEDVMQEVTGSMDFNLRALGAGFDASLMQVAVSGSFVITPVGTQTLQENLSDLQPRSHLYVMAGLTNLPLAFAFNTTTQADGYHQLTAVAYEGSHIRTQKRLDQSVLIQNTTLSAAFTCLVCDTNTALEATLQFSVVASGGTVTNIALFGTGGLLTSVTGQSSATFSVRGTNMGIGLHPFYAVVTRNDGKQYQTQTKWIRIIGAEPPFALSIAGTTPTVSWPATAGRLYEIVNATNVTDAFVLRDSTTPTNSAGQWSETNNAPPRQFYRVRSSQ